MGKALHTPGVVTAAEARLDDAGLFAIGGSGPVSARTGALIAPGVTALVSGTSATGAMTYAVAVHHWVTSRGTVADGVYRGAAETAQTVPTAAAPGSGSRIDVIYVKQNDQTSTLTPDADSAVVYGVVNGAVGGGKPSIPVGAEELATATVPAGVTRTDTGVTITQTARLTNLRGGPVPIRTAAELAGLPVYPTAQALELDTGRLRWHDGTRWRYDGDQATVATQAARDALTTYAGLQATVTADQSVWLHTGTAWKPILGGPIAALHATANQTLTNNVWTALLLAGESVDTHDGHSTTTNTSRWTCPAGWSGIYTVSGAVFASTVALLIVAIYVNGSPVRASLRRVNSTSDAGIDTTREVALNAGDYVEVWALQNSGGDRSTYADATYGSSLDVSFQRALP